MVSDCLAPRLLTSSPWGQSMSKSRSPFCLFRPHTLFASLQSPLQALDQAFAGISQRFIFPFVQLEFRMMSHSFLLPFQGQGHALCPYAILLVIGSFPFLPLP